jgi:hypothetical protein
MEEDSSLVGSSVTCKSDQHLEMQRTWATRTIEYTNAPINTIPKARRVFGAQTPFGGLLRGLLELGGFGRSEYPRRHREIEIECRAGRAGRALSFDKHLKDGLIADIMARLKRLMRSILP